MQNSSVPKARRSNAVIKPDRTRVLIRPFYPSSVESAQRIIDSILSIPERSAANMYRTVLRGFSNRHKNIEKTLRERFDQIQGNLNTGHDLSRERIGLIGSYFLMEYSPESAALFNPSIVPHPDQSGLPKGSLRFVLSLRAVGEGHISSITFRSGILDANNSLSLDRVIPFTLQAERKPNSGYIKDLFQRKLREAGIHDEFASNVINDLPDVFILEELNDVLVQERDKLNGVDVLADRSYQAIFMLAESNYEVHFTPDSDISQRILFPSGPTQSKGIEDARFVRFIDDEHDSGSAVYYATYTAYDGKITLPQLLETRDFVNFNFATLNGAAVRNKGMALFPRKIDGKYAMLARQDDENIFIMYSDNIHFWYSAQLLVKPAEPWEYIKIGTCGSPIETEYGWLVISHGVGPVRRYCIGAFLLDLDDPTRLIARLKTPLLEPRTNERDGYVPNVVYTCGAFVHGDDLVLPYAISDYATKFATFNLKALIKAMEKRKPLAE